MQVKDGEEDHPRIGHSSPLLTLWEKPSTRFETPKAIIYLHFACPEVRQKPRRKTWGWEFAEQHRRCLVVENVCASSPAVRTQGHTEGAFVEFSAAG